MAKLKLTPQLQKKMCDLIAQGSFVNRAAAACGITETTFYDWMNQGEKQPRGVFADFYNAVKQAEAASEVVAVGSIFNAGATDWRAYAWYLSHKFRDRWADRQQVDVSGAVQLDMESFKAKLLERVEKEANDPV